MPPNDLLSRAATTLRVGGQETFRNPPSFACAGETHEPFRLAHKPIHFPDQEEAYLSGVVRTTGGQFDGDRTDVHDTLSLVWGGVLRAFGLSSPFLIAEEHPVVPGEIGACHLILQQCPWRFGGNEFETARQAMNAWSAFAFHLLDDVFTWGRDRNLNPPDIGTLRQYDEPDWATRLTRYLRNPPDVSISRRVYPLWIYFGSQRRGVTVIRMPKLRIMFLKVLLLPYVPEVARGEDRLAIFANGLTNAIPYKLVEKANKILKLVGDASADTITLPLDSHCLFIGDKTIVALQGDFGREAFQFERQRFLERRSEEDRVFFADSAVEWMSPLPADDFESLSVDLVQREPGIIRAKPVGSTNERDGGRDILIERMVPKAHGAQVPDTATSDQEGIKPGGTMRVRVIAQVKSRSRTISKRDVQDIRDTLDRYQADGFLLIAHPRVSAGLVDHLEILRNTGKPLTDWWEVKDIEDRLRRHPDIARRYPNLVKLKLPT